MLARRAPLVKRIDRSPGGVGVAVTGVWPTREGLREEVRILTNAIRTPLFLDKLDPPTPNSLTASNGKPDNRRVRGCW